MKIEHTTDSPILLKLIPETPIDAFTNGERAQSFSAMGIPHKVEDGGIIVLNIDPDWPDWDDKDKRGIEDVRKTKTLP